MLLEILQAALAFDRISRVTVLASPAARRQFEMPASPKLQVVDVPKAESSVGRLLWALQGLDRAASRLNPDVLLGFNGIGTVRPDRRFASLVFVQQPVPYSREALRRFPQPMRLRMAVIGWVTRRSTKAADHVLVQTDVMRQTLVRAFGLPLERISVFLPGAPLLPPPRDFPKLRAVLADARNGILLYAGSESPHKNLIVVARGLQLVPPAVRPKWLVTLPESSGLCRRSGAVGLGHLPKAELHAAYRAASVLVMPSLTETVGLPMLEAMRAGTPVLAADRPYAHEVCEDAAVFFDPLSPADFADKLTRLLGDAALQADLVARGHALVRRRDAQDVYRAMVERVGEGGRGGQEAEVRR